MAERDRDSSGRARNARPRDSAGRPLPYGAAGLPRAPEVALPPAEALAEAERHLAGGRPFAAHEVLEAVWKSAPAPEAPLWRALAQLAVGLTHAQRGNARGTASLLRRGGEALAAAAAPGPHGIATSALAAWATRAADASERGQDLPPRPPLTAG